MNYFQIQDSHIFGNKLTLMFIQVETKLPFITDWNTELDSELDWILQAYHSPTKAQVIFNTFFFFWKKSSSHSSYGELPTVTSHSILDQLCRKSSFIKATPSSL